MKPCPSRAKLVWIKCFIRGPPTPIGGVVVVVRVAKGACGLFYGLRSCIPSRDSHAIPTHRSPVYAGAFDGKGVLTS